MSIVLAEDKQYYQDAAAVYAGAETIFQEEDTQPIHVPIIAPKRTINFDLVEEVPELNFSYDYLRDAMSFPDFSRSVAVIGGLHSGKTSFADVIVRHVRDNRSQLLTGAQVRIAKDQLNLAGNNATDSPWDNFKQTKPDQLVERYCDFRLDERERGLTLKSTPLSYMLPDSRGKSYLVNLIDTPGHVNFRDEADVACRISDGAVIVVDAVIGTSESLKRQIRYLLSVCGFAPSSLVLVITQMDRLVLEMRFPPADAYFKLRHIVDDLNATIAEVTGKRVRVLKPESGNVLFASGKFHFGFSLQSFVRSMYIDPARAEGRSFLLSGGEVPSAVVEEAEAFAQVLWGDIYCESGRFSKEPNEASKRSFVEFVLEPLYKIFGTCVGEEKESLASTLAQIGVYLPFGILDSNVEILLGEVFQILLGGVAAIVDAFRDFIPTPSKSAVTVKVPRFYTGSQSSVAAVAMKAGDPSGPLVVHCVKSIHTRTCQDFLVLARVYAGTLIKNQSVKILGEAYSFRSGETEDSVVTSIDALYIPGGRYFVETDKAYPGNWVLVSGISAVVTKTCTLVDAEANNGEDEEEAVEILRPIEFSIQAGTIKVACEPLQPTDLPKMVEGLRKLDRAYPQLHTKVEESGEHVIIGTGELYMDCALHDLRKLYGGDLLLEIKLADPAVVFNETCTETSQYQCSASSPNKLNALSFIAEPMEKREIESLIEAGSAATDFVGREEFFLSKEWRKQRLSLLVDECGWDALAARNLWAFGPDWNSGTNILLNDTLPDQVSKDDLKSIRESVVQGFQWATREGPLVEEPIRNCKFKLLDAVLNSSEIARGTGQIIPAACRAVYASLLTATPKLMEPICVAEIDCPSECMQAVVNILSKRRGHVIRDTPKPGTPFVTIIAYIPAIDSFGFETDLRLQTHGLGFGLSWFDHWAIVPGDPLDQQVEIRPLEAAPQMYLARDFLLKTRRRKGLADQVLLEKYLDDVVGMGLSRDAPAQDNNEDMWL